jgi:metal-responsive CopG/Arc/MetJ family transcriptional regulator
MASINEMPAALRIVLPTELRKKVDKRAKEQLTSVSSVVRLALLEFFARYDQPTSQNRTKIQNQN